MDNTNDNIGDLVGKIVISTPMMSLQCFNKTMIYICKHDEEGSVGIIINKIIPDVKVYDILNKLQAKTNNIENININFGGPEQIDQCFMLHTNDYMTPSTQIIKNSIALTINGDIVKAITKSQGPDKRILCMGCCLWEPFQLEDEIAANYWIPIPQDEALIFGNPKVDRWGKALLKIGTSCQIFASQIGNA